MSGSSLGAQFAGSPTVVKKYLGICLLPQAGVAIGLAILSSQLFAEINPLFSKMIIIVVMTETFIIELIGPMLVKLGVKKAGEVGLNVTEEDLIESHRVADMMDKNVPVISAGMLLSEVIEIVSTSHHSYYPIIDNDKKLIGAVTLDGIRNTFATQEVNDWLIALDIAEPVVDTITPDIWLAEAFDKAWKLDVDQLPVVSADNGDHYMAVFDSHVVRRRLSAEVLSRQKKADDIHHIQTV